MLLVHNSTFVSVMSTKPAGNVKPAMRVASPGFDARRPGLPARTMRLTRPPREMKTPSEMGFGNAGLRREVCNLLRREASDWRHCVSVKALGY